MDFYALCKFVHVAAVVIWVGSGVGLVVLGTLAERAQDRAELIHVIRQFLVLGRIQGPASGVALAFGLLMAWMVWSFTDVWIDIGLAAFAILFATGGLIFAPRITRAAAAFSGNGVSNAAVDDAHAVLMAARFDNTMLLVVVADMVFKPGADDWPLLIIMALAVIAAAVVFLGPLFRPRPAK